MPSAAPRSPTTLFTCAPNTLYLSNEGHMKECNDPCGPNPHPHVLSKPCEDVPVASLLTCTSDFSKLQLTNFTHRFPAENSSNLLDFVYYLVNHTFWIIHCLGGNTSNCQCHHHMCEGKNIKSFRMLIQTTWICSIGLKNRFLEAEDIYLFLTRVSIKVPLEWNAMYKMMMQSIARESFFFFFTLGEAVHRSSNSGSNRVRQTGSLARCWGTFSSSRRLAPTIVSWSHY